MGVARLGEMESKMLEKVEVEIFLTAHGTARDVTDRTKDEDVEIFFSSSEIGWLGG